MTLTPVVKRLPVELSLPAILKTWACRGRVTNTKPSAYKANALTDCTPVAAFMIYYKHLDSEYYVKIITLIHYLMIIFTYVRIQTSNVLRENELRSFEYAYQYYIWKQLEKVSKRNKLSTSTLC